MLEPSISIKKQMSAYDKIRRKKLQKSTIIHKTWGGGVTRFLDH